MNILLINPNKFQCPPVIPIGLEYLITSIKSAGHRARILDLCFAEDPLSYMDAELINSNFQLIGVTIRNIDSALFYRNEFYLNDIKVIVKHLKKLNIPIVLGGAGFSAMPERILQYLDADYGIIGPGENAILKLLKDIKNNKPGDRLINGWEAGFDTGLVHRRGKDIDYTGYIEKDGIVGFETHKGCSGMCSYCIEAGTKVLLKKIPHVLEELKVLVAQGYDRFHLCDSEFNNDISYSMDFCKVLASEKLGIRWTLYMKPSPYNEELFKLLKASGAYLITLSITSDRKERKRENYTLHDISRIINYCRKYDIKVIGDLIVGAPFEEVDSIEEMISFLKTARPDSVGIGFHYRVYENTGIAALIRENPGLKKYLSGNDQTGEALLEPVFFCNTDIEHIKILTAGDELFNIEGFRKDSNYQRIK